MTPVSKLNDTAVLTSWAETGPALLRLAERTAAVMAIPVVLPVLAAAAVTIAVLSGRGPLVSHRRVGLRGKALPMLKLRTMWAGAEPKTSWFKIEAIGESVPTRKCAGDARVSSRFAAFCRRYSIDELPQIFHVASGEMSFVGPRPITRRELEAHYSGCIEEVLSVPPGMTGLWQAMGRSRLTYARRRQLDLIFVRRRSPGLYGLIVLRSIRGLFQGDGV